MKAYPNKLQAVFNAIEDFLVVLDDQGRIVEVNPTVTKRLGYTRDELVGESVLLLHPPDRQAEVAAILTDVISGKRDDCRLPLLTKDQKSIPVETKFSRTKWGKQAALIGISRDITEYKRVEEVLSVYREHLEEVVQERTKALEAEIIERKRVEEQLAFQLDLLGNITDAVLATDENFIIQFWNSAAERMYGWKAEEVLGRHTVEVLDPEYLNHTRDEVIRIVHETGVVHWDTLQSRKDGTRIPVEGKTVVLRDAEGHIFGYATANRDITERKQAEDELRQSEEKYRQLFEVESDALFMLNGETAAIIEANLAAVELYQYRRDELNSVDP